MEIVLVLVFGVSTTLKCSAATAAVVLANLAGLLKLQEQEGGIWTATAAYLTAPGLSARVVLAAWASGELSAVLGVIEACGG